MYNSEKIAYTLDKLSFYHRIAFGASCCERQLPNYIAFCVYEKIERFTNVQDIMSMIWSFVEQKEIDVTRINMSIKICEDLLPDTEQFQSIFTGLALNAISSLIYTLKSCLNGDNHYIATVGQLVVDTNDEYIGIVTAPGPQPSAVENDYERWVIQSPLMSAELKKQNDDLVLLESSLLLTADIIDNLRRSSKLVGIHPFERGLLTI